MIVSRVALFAQAGDAAAVCTGEGEASPNAVCTALYEATGISWLSVGIGSLVAAIAQIAVIVVLAFLANRLVRRWIRRLAERLQEGGLGRLGSLGQRGALAKTGPINLARARQRTETLATVLRSLATVGIWSFALVLILGAVGINIGPLIAGAGIVGVALGFGSQTIVKDFLTGLFMLLEDQYGVGDIVDVGEATGVVEGVSLRTTRIRDLEGTLWHVPNGQIARVGNKSQLWARSLIDIPVAYDTDVAHATRVIKETADDLWRDPRWAADIVEEPEVWGVEAFAADQVLIRMVIKTEPARQWAVNRELRARLLVAFEREGIEIPLPQRVMRVRPEGREVLGDGARSGDGGSDGGAPDRTSSSRVTRA